MHRFEWNYKEIVNQTTFNNLVNELSNVKTGFNYEQGARLFYEGNNMTLMIELQIPTKDMIELTEEKELPWFDAYKVKHMEDYDASYEIYSGIGYGEVITYDNAERLMLELAKVLDVTVYNNGLDDVENVVCCHCGKTHTWDIATCDVYQGKYLCEDCYQDYYGYCNGCGKLHKYDDMNDDIYCEQCSVKELKEINRTSFEIEHDDGDTYMGFMLSIKEDGTIEVVKEYNCNLADIDKDYIFKSNNSLYRIQANK